MEKIKVQNCKMGYNKGDFKYSTDSTNFIKLREDYLKALHKAEADLEKPDLTIPDIVNINSTLASPGKAFTSNLWISDRRPLHEAIQESELLLSSTPEGNEPGHVSTDAKKTFSEEIKKAKKVRDSSYTIERQVEEAILALEEAKTLFLKSIVK
jgi:hypothetical protein